jgi:hypothetical protein
MAVVEGQLRESSMHDRELFVDGRWRSARQGRRAHIADPATGELVGSTAIADASDIDDAVAAAKRALPLSSGRTPTSARAFSTEPPTLSLSVSTPLRTC